MKNIIGAVVVFVYLVIVVFALYLWVMGEV
jgi:hypothetical protein